MFPQCLEAVHSLDLAKLVKDYIVSVSCTYCKNGVNLALRSMSVRIPTYAFHAFVSLLSSLYTKFINLSCIKECMCVCVCVGILPLLFSFGTERKLEQREEEKKHWNNIENITLIARKKKFISRALWWLPSSRNSFKVLQIRFHSRADWLCNENDYVNWTRVKRISSFFFV